jgi:hypothetical protein
MSQPQLLKSWSNGSLPHPKGITPRLFEMGTEKISNFFCSHLKQSWGKGPLLLIKNRDDSYLLFKV